MTQSEVDRMLKWGVIFSLLWLVGVGSLVAFVLGWKAKVAIEASNSTLMGTGASWWCLIVGGLGILIWVPLILIGIYNQI